MAKQGAPDAQTNWLRAIAWEVAELLDLPGARDTFRRRVRQRAAEDDARRDRIKEWERERAHYFERVVPTDPTLADGNNDRDGMVWEGYINLQTLDAAKRARSAGRSTPSVTMREAWTPFGLTEAARPKGPLPLFPLDTPGRDPLTTAERYAALALIHDALCAGAEPINPWHGLDFAELDGTEKKRAAAFALLVRQCRLNLAADSFAWLAPHETDKEAVQAILASVKRDLDPQTAFRESVEAVARRVEDRGGALLTGYKPMHPDVLDGERLNVLARTLGLIGPDRCIVEEGETESDGDDRPSRWVRVHHPDPNVLPAEVVTWTPMGAHVPPASAKRMVDFLRAWAAKAAESATPLGGGGNGVPRPPAAPADVIDPATLAAAVVKAMESRGAPADDDAPAAKLPTLKPWAMEAWKARQVGMTVTAIAATLADKYNDPRITQPRVSEQIQRAMLHAEASGLAVDAARVLPQVGSRAPARTLDPAAAELGKRTDGKAHHLRERERQKAQDGDDDE